MYERHEQTKEVGKPVPSFDLFPILNAEHHFCPFVRGELKVIKAPPRERGVKMCFHFLQTFFWKTFFWKILMTGGFSFSRAFMLFKWPSSPKKKEGEKPKK